MTADTANSSVPTQVTIGLADMIGLLRRQFWLIVAITAGFTGVAAVALTMVAPRYSAEALLMIDNRASNLMNLETVITGLSGDPASVMSEIEVLKSTRLANQVVDQLKLDQRPEFNEALRPPGLVENLLRAGTKDAAARPLGEVIKGQRVRVLNTFMDRLEVRPRPNSRVVSVAFSSEDAHLAAAVANSLSELYLRDQLESKFEAMQRASAWLNDRVSSLRDQVQESERRVEEFRARSGLLEGGGMTLADQEVSQLNSDVVEASNARAAAQAQLDQVRRHLTESGAESVGEVLRSPLVQTLREQQVGILRQLAELGTEYGERHPTMIKLRADAAEIATKIDTEIAKIVSGLESDLVIARDREAAVTAELDAAKLRISEDNKALVTLRALERDAGANRILLENMLARLTETSAQDDLASQRPDARIIAQALVANSPSFPKKKPILALVIVSAGFLGLMLAFARQLTDDHVRSAAELHEVTGLRSLGFVPSLDRRTLRKHQPADLLVRQPGSAYAESLRSVFASLVNTQGKGASHSLLVVSSQTNDGKTTLALSLARTIALTGKQVIVLDADCRASTLATSLGIPNEPGLTDLLRDEAELSEVVGDDQAAGVAVICAGRAVDNPPALFAAPAVKRLLDRLASDYDYVIIDSPPTMAASDATILAQVVDRTLLVARWGATRRAAVVLAVQQLKDAGASFAGAVLTRVNVRKYARYGYGDSGAYTGELARYYRS